MIRLDLTPAVAQLWHSNPFGDAVEGPLPLYHQWKTAEASAWAGLVINTYPTGVGKTTAALLPLLGRHRTSDCLFIAPTNELLAQHVGAARSFCQRARLDHQVIEITAARIDQLKDRAGSPSARRAAVLAHYLNDPRAELGLEQRQPVLVITNPDLFYLALYQLFNRQDRRNLFRAIFRFKYLIIDEFHYYNEKQFANFLFFLGFLRGYGYFEEGQQVCLLSATPHPHFRAYLDRLGIPIADVAPNIDAAESLPTTPVLSPAGLTVHRMSDCGGLDGLIDSAEIARMAARLQAGDHGAVISTALWRVNQLYDHLLGPVTRAKGGLRIARLTGAESSAGRTAARAADLLLATATVDIGYNFERREKPRQSLDFLYCDARFPDELIQRVGRAGRVLGKPLTDQPSEIVAVVSDPLYEALTAVDGTTVTRPDFARLLATLPHHHSLTGYIRTGAIGEAFLPIYQLYQATSPAEQGDVRQLYEEIRELFAANTRLTFDRLLVKTRSFIRLREWVGKVDHLDEQEVRRHAQRFLEQSESERGTRYSAGQRAELLAQIRRPGTALHDHARAWLDEQIRRYQVLNAAFSFRETFSPPEALIHDPQRLLSSAEVSRYDVLHVAANYRARFFGSRREWIAAAGVADVEEADFYCRLQERLPPDQRRQIELHLSTDEELDRWEDASCGRLVALTGLSLRAANGIIAPELANAWHGRYLVVLAFPEDARPAGQLRGLARDAALRLISLWVYSEVSGARRCYICALGTSALLAEAELRRSIILWRRGQAGHEPMVI